MTILEKYATLLIQRDAIDAVLTDIRKDAKRELKACKDQSADCLGVKFHMTKKPTRVFSARLQSMLDKLKTAMDRLKENAEKSGAVVIKNKITFDAEIPSPIKEDLFEGIAEYRNHFALRK